MNLPSSRADERKQGVKTHTPAVPQHKPSLLHASSAPPTQRRHTGPSHQHNWVFFPATKQEYGINPQQNNPQIGHGTAVTRRASRANPINLLSVTFQPQVIRSPSEGTRVFYRGEPRSKEAQSWNGAVTRELTPAKTRESRRY